MRARLEFKVEDLWIGAFWKKRLAWSSADEVRAQWDLWLCLIPTLPLHLTWYSRGRKL